MTMTKQKEKQNLPRRFDNPKDLLDYLKNEAKSGEQVILDERADGVNKRRIKSFRKSYSVRRGTVKSGEVLRGNARRGDVRFGVVA